MLPHRVINYDVVGVYMMMMMMTIQAYGFWRFVGDNKYNLGIIVFLISNAHNAWGVL